MDTIVTRLFPPGKVGRRAAHGAPAISRQPAAATVVSPGVAKFSVTASGSPTPTYQWQLSIDGGSTYSNIALATGTSYTTPATKTSDSGRRYRVRVSNSAGSVMSSAAVLTVAAVAQAPSITSQPSSKTVTAPAAVSLSVVATGAPSPSYQWQVSTDGGQTYTSIVGATGSTYRLAKTSTPDTRKRSRYTHRVAISNSRLVALDERGVTFRWKDYRDKGCTRHKTMTLDAGEFMRRFLLHVLPGGFHRIRHDGLLANGCRRANLALARQMLGVHAEDPSAGVDVDTATASPTFVCRHCGQPMIILQTFTRGQTIRAPPMPPAAP